MPEKFRKIFTFYTEK